MPKKNLQVFEITTIKKRKVLTFGQILNFLNERLNFGNYFFKRYFAKETIFLMLKGFSKNRRFP